MDIERHTSPSDSRNDDYAMCDSDGDSLPTPSEVIIDESGDAEVIAKTAGATRSFVVYSRAFALVCEPWKSMVKYRATMGTPVSASATASTSRMEFTLEDDDWSALELVLRIAHLQFDRISSAISLADLLQLSILTDKYQATGIVRPWVSGWIQTSWDKSTAAQKVQHIWIAWEYGLITDFEKLVSTLVLEAQTNEYGTALFHEGKALEDRVPPGLVDSILEARASVMEQLLRIINPYIEKCSASIEEARLCRFADSACDASICGSLILGLHGLELFPLASQKLLTISVNKLVTTLNSLRIHTIKGNAYTNHSSCDFSKVIFQQVDTTPRLPSPFCRDGHSPDSSPTAEELAPVTGL
ncbi:unnamed protein product [Zymoseptoria tritici ST99CH_1E4]|uniref:BTB domain-containing protein n=2 Tax=Zymoseptoria tritici TaxID=1047171 RepID=A0A2H1H5N5_ZYMTR|nr:unnamed protein product [Zymoseptoria tritici ST99CH_1E4]